MSLWRDCPDRSGALFPLSVSAEFLVASGCSGISANSRSCFSLVNNYMTEGRQKRFIKRVQKQYLSPAVIEELWRIRSILKLGGERRELSIFFSDIQGFTRISEKLNLVDRSA